MQSKCPAGDIDKVVECLPNKHNVLGSIPINTDVHTWNKFLPGFLPTPSSPPKILHKYFHLSVSAGDWSQDFHGY
jgi:hypothetical protein